MLKPLKKQLLIPIVAALAILLVPGLRAAETIPARMSPIVTFDPDRGMISRPPTKRPLTAAELKLARERADRMFDAIKVSPSFSRPV